MPWSRRISSPKSAAMAPIINPKPEAIKPHQIIIGRSASTLPFGNSIAVERPRENAVVVTIMARCLPIRRAR